MKFATVRGGLFHAEVDGMGAHGRILGPDTVAVQASSGGWRELHAALRGGVPHATEIVMLLDSLGFRFPAAPTFDALDADVRCYRVVHRAWREGLLSELLRLLGTWRRPDGSLREAARRGEFQQALLDFLRDNRRDGLAALAECLGRQPSWQTAPEGDAASVETVRQRLDALCSNGRGRRAA